MCAWKRCGYYKKYGECSSEYGDGEGKLIRDGMVETVWGRVFGSDF